MHGHLTSFSPSRPPLCTVPLPCPPCQAGVDVKSIMASMMTRLSNYANNNKEVCRKEREG